VFNKRILKI